MGNEPYKKESPPSPPLSSFIPPPSPPNKEIGMIMNVSNEIFNYLTSIGKEKSFYWKFCSDLDNGEITTLINGNEKTPFYDFNKIIISKINNYYKEENFFTQLNKMFSNPLQVVLNPFNLITRKISQNIPLTFINSKMINGFYSALQSKIFNSYGLSSSLSFKEKDVNYIQEPKIFDSQLQTILDSLENNREDNKKHNKDKYIIIISDGTLIKKYENLNYLKREAQRNNIIIITLLLTDYKKGTKRIKKLYNKFPSHLNETVKNLFDITSKVNYNNAFAHYFIKKGWSFPEEGEGTLLFETSLEDLNNDSFAKDLNQVSYEGIDIKIRQLNYNSLIHFKYNFITKNQVLGTCWANAYAAAIFLINKTIIGRKVESFETIRENLIKYACEKYTDGGNIQYPKVTNFLKSKKVYFKDIDEQQAKYALMKGSFVVCHFKLNNKQWKNFDIFFSKEKTRTEILTKEVLNKGCQRNVITSKPDIGHAVLLIEFGQGFLRFLDSQGPDQGDEGTFKVKNAEVLTSYTTNKKAEFFEIFIKDEDMTKEEIQYYNNNIEYIKELLGRYEDLSAIKIIKAVKRLYKFEYLCQRCKSILKIEQSYITFDLGINGIYCPVCRYLNEGKGKLKELVVMNHLLSDGNKDFDINYEEKYYIIIERLELYEDFEKNNDFVNESDSCSLGYLNIEERKVESPFNKMVKNVIHLRDNIFIVSSLDMVMIFELIMNIEGEKIHHSFNILINKKIYKDNLLTLCALKYHDIIITGGDDLKFFEFVYEKKDLKPILTMFSKKINKINLLEKFSCQNNEKIIVCDQKGYISLYEIKKNENQIGIFLIFNVKYHQSSINNILYLPEEDFLVSLCNGEAELKFWEIDNNGLKYIDGFGDKSFLNNNNCMINIKNDVGGEFIGFLLIGAKDGIQIIKHKNKKIIGKNYFYEDKEFGDIYSIEYLGNNYFICGRTFGFCSIFLLKGDNIKKINIFRNNNAWVYNSYLSNSQFDKYYITDICFKEICYNEKGICFKYLLVTSFDKTVKIYLYANLEINNNKK